MTAQELEIMKIVWQLGAATVRDVYETMLARRKIAYTTVMTMMKIMARKGYLKKRLAGRAYVYRPAEPRRQIVRRMVSDFIGRVFDGSAEPLLLHLVEERHVSEKDLAQIARMIRDGKQGSQS